MSRNFLRKEFIEVGEDLYELVEKFQDEKDFPLDDWKNHLRVEKVFRKDGLLFFCNLIPNVKILDNDDGTVQHLDKESDNEQTSDGEKQPGVSSVERENNKSDGGESENES